MNYKKIVFSLLMAVAFVAPNFASNNPIEPSNESSKALTEIREAILDIEFEVETIDAEKVSMTFMVNSYNEVVVLKTSNTQVDRKIKSTLNYKKLEHKDLQINKIYTLPIRFTKE